MPQRSRCFTALLFVLLAACRREQASDSQPAFRTSAEVVPAGGSLVKVSFQGTICHMLRDVRRSVVIRGDDKMPHTPVLIIPNDLAEGGEAAIVAVSGFKPDIKNGMLEIPLDRIGMQVVARQGGSLQPALEAGADFDALAPHLEQITDPKFTQPHDLIQEDIPSEGSPVAAYFLLTAGHLSSDAQCTRAKFNADVKDRRFSDVVTLTAITDTPAELQLRSHLKTTWTPIPMKQTDVLLVRIENRATPTSGHFPMHARLALPALGVAMPEITDTLSCESGLAPGCSNTQWP